MVQLSSKSVHWFGRDAVTKVGRNCFIILDIINVASFGSHTVASSVLSTIFCGIFWQVHFSVIELRLRLHRRKWVIQLQHNYIEKTCNQLRLPITCNCNWVIVIVIQLRLLPMSDLYYISHSILSLVTVSRQDEEP